MMEIKKRIEKKVVEEVSYKLELTKEEIDSLRYLLEGVKGDWYYDDNTLKILNKLKNVGEKENEK